MTLFHPPNNPFCHKHPLHRLPCVMCLSDSDDMDLKDPKAHTASGPPASTLNERQPLMDALIQLNDEGFNAIVWDIYQKSKTAGGYTDHKGWANVRVACEKIKWVADTQAKFDEKYKELDEQPPMKVVPVEGGDKKSE